MAGPSFVFVARFDTGPCLCQLLTVPPCLRRDRELREIKQHRRKPVPAVIGVAAGFVHDPQLLNQATYAGGELRAHLCRCQACTPRQLSGVTLAGKRKTWIYKQKQRQTCKTLIRYPEPQQP